MKQTAVEYIKEKLLCDEYWFEDMTFDQIIEQAKAMEKEQIIEAHNSGYSEGIYQSCESGEEYYTETYESKTNL